MRTLEDKLGVGIMISESMKWGQATRKATKQCSGRYEMVGGRIRAWPRQKGVHMYVGDPI